MKKDKKQGLGRRDFLRALGAGAGLAVTAAGPLASEAAATETAAEAKKKRYNPNSDEVKTYYRVNRY
jgi:nitrous oxide reductase